MGVPHPNFSDLAEATESLARTEWATPNVGVIEPSSEGKNEA